MNGLSWLIYLANIGAGVSNFLLFVGFFVGLALIGCIFVRFVTAGMATDHENSAAAQGATKFWLIVKPWFKAIFVLFFVLQLTGRMIPDRQTVLLIAASEIGQRLLESKEVKDVVNPSVELLTTWMQKETLALKDEIAKKVKDAVKDKVK